MTSRSLTDPALPFPRLSEDQSLLHRVSGEGHGRPAATPICDHDDSEARANCPASFWGSLPQIIQNNSAANAPGPPWLHSLRLRRATLDHREILDGQTFNHARGGPSVATEDPARTILPIDQRAIAGPRSRGSCGHRNTNHRFDTRPPSPSLQPIEKVFIPFPPCLSRNLPPLVEGQDMDRSCAKPCPPPRTLIVLMQKRKSSIIAGADRPLAQTANSIRRPGNWGAGARAVG